jgi:hypothetical protein
MLSDSIMLSDNIIYYDGNGKHHKLLRCFLMTCYHSFFFLETSHWNFVPILWKKWSLTVGTVDCRVQNSDMLNYYVIVISQSED